MTVVSISHDGGDDVNITIILYPLVTTTINMAGTYLPYPTVRVCSDMVLLYTWPHEVRLATPPRLAAVRPGELPVLLFLGLARVDDGDGMPISSRDVYVTLRNRSARPVSTEKGRS